MARLYLALGSNLGDRERNLCTALEKLDAVFGPRVAVSPLMNTASCGFSGPDFLNGIVVYESRRRALTILGICKLIETEMGRRDVPEYDSRGDRVYHDRIIDIDILKYGNLHIQTQELNIPHPQMESRPYIKELLLHLQVVENI